VSREFSLKLLGINSEEEDIMQQFDDYGPPHTVSGFSIWHSKGRLGHST